MVLDLELFSSKLTRYCKQYLVDNTDITMSTGIPSKRLVLLMEGKAQPTGDEILILADYFKCDFKFFISNEMLAPFEQTDELFRRHGGELSREDRWSIQEFLFLCECQDFLIKELNLLTLKPTLYALNVAENDLRADKKDILKKFNLSLDPEKVILVSAKIESELAELAPDCGPEQCAGQWVEHVIVLLGGWTQERQLRAVEHHCIDTLRSRGVIR